MHDYTHARLEPQTRAILDFAAKLTRTPGDMAQADVQRLRNHGFSDEQILSTVLITCTCTFNFMTRLADGLGVEPPEDRQESHSQRMSEAARSQDWLMTPPVLGGAISLERTKAAKTKSSRPNHYCKNNRRVCLLREFKGERTESLLRPTSRP